jgi:hypothetical protein
MPATGSIQNESAFRRGNAMSCAPSMIGITKFPRPANAGMTNRKIISAACTENSALYVAGEKYCAPGVASSARTPSASSPPMMKKMNVVTRYWTPITLWSVLTLK